MPRQRMIKPEFFNSETIAKCSYAARILFVGLWVMGDDNGNIKAQPKRLKVQIFPYDDITDEAITLALCELEDVGCIKGYEIDGERYINIPNFSVYQTIRKPSNTSIPTPPKDVKNVTSTSLVRHWYDTSAAPEKTNNSRPGETSLVRHQYGTSDAQKKERKKEVVVAAYTATTTSLVDNNQARVAAGGEDPTTPRATMSETELVELFAEADKATRDMALADAQIAQWEAEATSCPPEVLQAMKGGAA